MKITVICAKCRNYDKDPNLEINFKDSTIYYMCSECKKENKISLQNEYIAYPKGKRLR